MSWKERFNYICGLISLYWTFLISLYLALIWYAAWFNNYHIMVTINYFQEAIPEFVMWIFVLPIVIYGFYLNFKKVF